ncbi:hypothetical protein [Streptomyces sp. NPDC051657]
MPNTYPTFTTHVLPILREAEVAGAIDGWCHQSTPAGGCASWSSP